MAVTGPAAAPPDTHPLRWRMLTLLGIAELLGMSLWFAGSAVAPHYRELWQLSASEAAWLTTVVQLGFVAGTAISAVLNLADIVPSRWLFAISASIGAAANAALLASPDYSGTLVWRFITGMALAGVYPPAMKMAATWFRSRRGLAVGVIVGALTVGKALPYLVHAAPGAGIRSVLLATTIAAAIGAVLVAAGYRDGPYPFLARPFSWRLVGTVTGARRWRFVLGGYLGHMFELYSAWTWLPVFVAASIAARGSAASVGGAGIADLIGFAALAVGGAGCVWGGLAADRLGRERIVTISMAVSGTCAALIGLAFGRSLWLLVPVALVWGFFVIADSAQFSVLAAESVPQHAVGTALTLQVSLGFLLTTVTIQLVPWLAERTGWSWAFVILALGPVAGIAAIRRISGRAASDAQRAEHVPAA
jgi:MFS family permease